MFIKWVRTSDWWQVWGNPIKGLFWFWVFISWLFLFVDMLPNNGDITEAGKFLHYRLTPFMVITGILPSLYWFTRRCAVGIRDLYYDYQYFAANGGKRKREDKEQS